MDVTTTPVVVLHEAKGTTWTKIRNRVGYLFAFLAALVVVAPTAASAAPAPANTSLLQGSETSFFSSIQGFLTGNLLPLVFVLAAVVIGATMLIKYGRKAVSS